MEVKMGANLAFEASDQVLHDFLAQIYEDFKKGFEDYKELDRPFPYKKASQLKKELEISDSYLEKLCRHGLKRVILEEGDKTVWYDPRQLTELMDSLAE